MSLLGSIGKGLSSVGKSISHALNSTFGPDTTTVLRDAAYAAGGVALAATAPELLGSIGTGVSADIAGGSVAGTVLSGIGTANTAANVTATTANTSIIGSIENLFKGGFSSFLNTSTSILNDIHSGISDVAKLESSVVSPIASLVHGISTDVQALNDQVIAPIQKLIQTSTKTSQALETAVHNDLNKGIAGMMKFANDVSSALTSADASLQRAMQELGTNNRDIVTKDLVPGLSEGIGSHVARIADLLTSPEFPQTSGAAVEYGYKLSPPGIDNPIIESLREAVKSVEDSTGPYAFIVKAMYSVLLAVDYILGMAEVSLEPIKQKALADQRPTLLGIGEAIEAWRRGILNDKDAQEEIALHGLSDNRIGVLYELAQFLFGPREAVELHQRGIIDDQTFATLIDQNNLDAGQAQSLLELMQKVLGPGDIAAANARGFVDAQQMAALFKAALVPESIQQIVFDLELSLMSPEQMTAVYGRQLSAINGLLERSLTSAVPPEIQKQFDRVQAEPGSAELAWLRHWDIPQAAWWVDAFFRNLRTRTEVEQAFQALNIPEELWADIFAVEEELPPVWLVPDVIATGVWGEAEAVPTLMKLGFSKANAEVLYQYGVAKGAGKAAATVDSLAKVSLGNAKAAFDDGLINPAEYEQILLDHKYSPAAAALTVQLAEYEAAQKYIKAQADLIVEKVKLGLLDTATAESQLYTLGLNTNQVATYIDKIETARVVNAKLPSVADIKAMFKKSILDPSQTLAAMILIGYDQTWAERIIQTW